MPVPHRLHDLELLVPANGMEGQCDKQTFKLMKKYLGLHQTKCISSSSSGQQTLKSRPKKNIIQKFRAKNYPKLQCRTPWSKAPKAGSCPVSPRHAKRMSLNLVNLCTALPPPTLVSTSHIGPIRCKNHEQVKNFRIELSQLTQDRMQMSWIFPAERRTILRNAI